MREMVSLNRKGNNYDHPDLHKTRSSKDEASVQAICDLRNSWKNPFSDDALELMSLSSGPVPPEYTTKDLLGAHDIGEKCYNQFRQERLMNSETMKSFHDRLPNCKLKTLAYMKKASKLVKNKGTETVLRADRNLFGLMILVHVAQKRKLQMSHCHTACKKDKCPCLDNGMKYAQMCMLKTCENQGEYEEEDTSVRDECEDCDNDREEDEDEDEDEYEDYNI